MCIRDSDVHPVARIQREVRVCLHPLDVALQHQHLYLRQYGAEHVRHLSLIHIFGTGKIQGERLDIEITSLEYDGTIIPVELAVYDTDGQQMCIRDRSGSISQRVRTLVK